MLNSLIDKSTPNSLYSRGKKIRRSFRFAHQWGVQFHGDDFDFLSFYQTDTSFDINRFHINAGNDVLDLDFHDALVLDEDPH